MHPTKLAAILVAASAATATAEPSIARTRGVDRWFARDAPRAERTAGGIAAPARSGAILQNQRLRPADIDRLPSAPPDHRLSYGTDSLQFGELRLPDGDGPFHARYIGIESAGHFEVIAPGSPAWSEVERVILELVTDARPRNAATAAPAAAAETLWDVYIAGVRVAELSIDDRTTPASYTIRKKDPGANRWLTPVTVLEDRVAADTAFLLRGSVRALPARMPSLRAIDWPSLRAVGWPDTATIYVRHRELRDTAAGRAVSATYWAQRDASRPLDLVISDDNQLVAGIDVSADIVMVRRGYERFTTVSRWTSPAVSQPRYGYRPAGRFMVPAADGVRLATLVYLPVGDIQGPFPAVLIRTPYGIGGLINQYWPHAARGYALVFQATRGTSHLDPENRSEGSWEPLIHEPADGAATLEWITRQPWSNGRICMQGASYVGYTQWAASMAANPALRCVIAESSMGTAFADQPYMGGGFVEGLAYYLFWMLDIPLLQQRSWTEILHYRPLIRLDEFATGRDIPQWNTFFEHWRNDAYWQRQNWHRSEAKRNFASLQISGWFDDDFAGTESNWALMRRTGTAPHRLVVGPWKHGYNIDRSLNGFSFGIDALRDDIVLLKQKWLDRFLKDMDNGVDATVVEYFELGENEWRTTEQWPAPQAERRMWYLHSNGQAHRFSTAGSLTTSPPTTVEPPDVYRYDPQHPVPNWMSFEQMERWEDVQTFPYDFKDIEARPDVVVFTSPPLEDDVTIAGDILAVLYASTDVRDTDWWVHVSDVYPDGRSVRLTTGMLRARFRDVDDPQHHVFGSNFERERLLSGDPEEIVRYEIGVRSIANTFRRGHRIRVAVMNALDNYSFPNSNTGEDEAYVTRTVVGTMTVHHDPEHPSHVVLPVMRR